MEVFCDPEYEIVHGCSLEPYKFVLLHRKGHCRYIMTIEKHGVFFKKVDLGICKQEAMIDFIEEIEATFLDPRTPEPNQQPLPDFNSIPIRHFAPPNKPEPP